MNIFYTGLTTLFLGGLVSLLFNKGAKLKCISFFSFIALILTSSIALKVLLTGNDICSVIKLSEPFKNVPIVIDGLSAFFILFISIMSFTSVIYANGYLKPYFETSKNLSSHCFFLMSLIASMLMVTVVQNALFFLVVWELMSISSFFLVAFESNQKEVISASIKYLVYMHISLLFILMAFVLMNIKSASFDFENFRVILQNNSAIANLFFALTFIGFGIKAGFVPFHNWLPDAHPAAPSHISAVMSGVMIKTGIYGILRVITLIQTPNITISYFVLFISVISALYGVLYALAQHDLKKLLAYSSIENIGIIGIGMGIGMLGLAYNQPIVATLGFMGCILHILNHSIFKELLFLGAGAVYNKTHTRNVEILGGLLKKMPYTALFFLAGSVAICALPPFNGFIGEMVIYYSMLKGILAGKLELFMGLAISIASLAFVGTMAILCFSKAFSVIFLGETKSKQCDSVQSDVSKTMLIPMGILALSCLLIGIFPKQIIKLFSNVLNAFSFEIDILKYMPFDFMGEISTYTFAFFCVVVIFITARVLLSNKNRAFGVWVCGYDKINKKMQYSASSFVAPFLTMAKPLFVKKFDVKKPNTLFPKDAHFSLNVEDVEEEYIIKPIIKIDKEFLSKFQILQSGNLQQYILFGLIFLILLLIGIGIWG